MTRFCTECGSQIEEKDKFCGQCGSRNNDFLASQIVEQQTTITPASKPIGSIKDQSISEDESFKKIPPVSEPNNPTKKWYTVSWIWLWLFIFTGIATTIFEGITSPNYQPQVAQTNAPQTTQTNTSPFDAGQICRASISTAMYQPVNIINLDNASGGIGYLSYKRPSDGSKWAYKCKISGNRVIWASNSGDATSRWRDTPNDEKITYSINGVTLTIKENYSGGTINTQSFSYADLQ